MNIAINSSIILLLITVIPAGIALTIALLRSETIRGDARAAARELQDVKLEYVRISAQFTEYTDRLSSLSAGSHAAGLRMTGIEESLTSVSNKLSSRERADRLAQRRINREEEMDDAVDIPGTKQQKLDFSKLPGVIPLQPHPVRPPVPVNNQIEEFEEFPGRFSGGF
jgi:hypothetical protein